MKTVLLCSGGIDSVVLSDWLVENGYEVVHLFVDYGQPVAAQERAAASAQAVRHGQPFIEISVPLAGVEVFGKEGACYVPSRNAVLVSLAANLAAAVGAGSVHYGATAEDYDAYPDCRPGYVSLLSRLTEQGSGVRVKTPLVTSTRAQILEYAEALRSDLSRAWSCYRDVDGEQCGDCASCLQGAE